MLHSKRGRPRCGIRTLLVVVLPGTPPWGLFVEDAAGSADQRFDSDAVTLLLAQGRMVAFCHGACLVPEVIYQLSRRAFIQGGSLLLLGAAATTLRAAEDRPRKLRAGLVTDLHHADKPTSGTRHYRDTLGKLNEAAKQFATDKPDFIIELGDFIDAADSVEAEQAYLDQVSKVFATIPGRKHYVLGNHCVDTLTKEEFLARVGAKESFYSFDMGGYHFVALDSCFRSDGKPYGRKSSVWTDANIPAHELDWLQADLKATDKSVIVFAHQRLDNAGQHSVKNAADVRKALEASGKVLAVFQGHSHKNDHQEIAGIHYATLVAMVEGAAPANSGYSIIDVLDDGAIRLTGFRKQANYNWMRRQTTC
jgi:predicted phosphodiesterase